MLSEMAYAVDGAACEPQAQVVGIGCGHEQPATCLKPAFAR
jgi:hypothetical protein